MILPCVGLLLVFTFYLKEERDNNKNKNREKIINMMCDVIQNIEEDKEKNEIE